MDKVDKSFYKNFLIYIKMCTENKVSRPPEAFVTQNNAADTDQC
jgi:hypothetical protein